MLWLDHTHQHAVKQSSTAGVDLPGVVDCLLSPHLERFSFECCAALLQPSHQGHQHNSAMLLMHLLAALEL
jgi:hypothetical protein